MRGSTTASALMTSPVRSEMMSPGTMWLASISAILPSRITRQRSASVDLSASTADSARLSSMKPMNAFTNSSAVMMPKSVQSWSAPLRMAVASMRYAMLPVK